MKKSPKKTTKKRMTIEDLARMFANSFSELSGRVDGLQDEMRAGFKKSDDQFEKVNHRLDVHIAQTAQGFEDVDKRFDALEAGTHRRITLVESTVAGMMKREVKK